MTSIFSGLMAEKIADHSTGDVADEFYYHYKVWLHTFRLEVTKKATTLFLFNLIKCNFRPMKLFQQDDISLLKNLGFDAFRFSISWPRILPSKNLVVITIREDNTKIFLSFLLW